MFFLKLLIGLIQAPVRRIAELLGLDGGAPQEAREGGRPPQTTQQARPGRAQPEPTPLDPRRPSRGAPVRPPRPSRVKEVDEEPVLAAEYAEEGAEDGVGAEVHVDEPWEGYAQMRVPELKERLNDASAAELAAVQLYELTHRKRSSVIATVEARMRAEPS